MAFGTHNQKPGQNNKPKNRVRKTMKARKDRIERTKLGGGGKRSENPTVIYRGGGDAKEGTCLDVSNSWAAIGKLKEDAC